MTPKKIPERKCVGCGGTYPKSTLIRIVRSPDGEISLDRTGKKSGRGAYLCHCAECLKMAKKANRLSRNLECEIPDTVYTRLEAELRQYV